MDTLDFSWADEDPGVCADCGAPHEWVRPGKTQPTCECGQICALHHVRIEYRSPPLGVTGRGSVSGWVCPQCFPADRGPATPPLTGPGAF